MSFISSGLPDTDYRDDDADNRHHNIDKFKNHSVHQCACLSLYFPYVSPPSVLEALKSLQDVKANLFILKQVKCYRGAFSYFFYSFVAFSSAILYFYCKQLIDVSVRRGAQLGIS